MPSHAFISNRQLLTAPERGWLQNSCHAKLTSTIITIIIAAYLSMAPVKPKQDSERALKCRLLGVKEWLMLHCVIHDWGRNDIWTRTQAPIPLKKTSSECTGKITECVKISSRRCYHIMWRGAYLLLEMMFWYALKEKLHSLGFGIQAQPSHWWLFALFPCCWLCWWWADRHMGWLCSGVSMAGWGGTHRLWGISSFF